jgi:hypothetical protein
MSAIYLTKNQKDILSSAVLFYTKSNSFHFAKALQNIIMSKRFKDAVQFYTVRSVLSSIVPQFQINKHFNLFKEVIK